MIDPTVLKCAADFAASIFVYIELTPIGFRIAARNPSGSYVAEHVLAYALVEQATFPVMLLHDEIMRVRRMAA